MKKHFLMLTLVIGLFPLSADVACAQTSSATISGHVIDQSKGVVPNAEVRLINEQTNVVVTTHVLPNGDFTFPDVHPGSFSVTVQSPGYKETKKVNLVLSASQNLSAGTIVLLVGAVSES